MMKLLRLPKLSVVSLSAQYSSSAEATVLEPSKFQPFADIQRQRREQAKRSVLFTVDKLAGYDPLLTLVERSWGKPAYVCHHTWADQKVSLMGRDDHDQFKLTRTAEADRSDRKVELPDAKMVHDVLAESAHFDADVTTYYPVKSRLLYFQHASSSRKSSSNFSGPSASQSLPDLKKLLAKQPAIDEQLIELHRATQLTEPVMRLHNFVYSLIEDAISGLFPAAECHLFGSSVSGFGRLGSDVDAVLDLTGRQDIDKNSKASFRYMTKPRTNNHPQILLEWLGDTLKRFIPYAVDVTTIRHARVPIVKFRHVIFGFSCDISLTNMSAVYMAQLLWTFSQLDRRVAPLFFTIRHYAKVAGLTRDFPGTWFSNFHLLLLLVFFLQSTPKPILPTISTLKKLAGPNRMMIDGCDCSLVSDISLIPRTSNVASMHELLLEFWQFYENFDFTNKAISLETGTVYVKPDFSPIFLDNPYEREHNITRNVNHKELEQLKNVCRQSLWKLESGGDDDSLSGINRLLFSSSSAPILQSTTDQKFVSSLFEANETTITAQKKNR